MYDGWNLLGELGMDGSVIPSYMWGLDLSGTTAGAGGVGGLLSISDSASLNGLPSTHYLAYDGNGNVAGLVNSSDGSVSAQYEYGPFGEVIRATGPMATANPFRFSTKYQDDESGLFYYGYRYYNANTGGWLSRDPIGERGGLNSYGFVGNHPVASLDPYGQAEQMVGFSMDLRTGSVTSVFAQQNSFQDYGIGLHGPIPLSPMARAYVTVDRGWNWALDQITPPIDPDKDPYAFASAQTARELSLNALLAILTESGANLVGKGCSGATVPAAEGTTALDWSIVSKTGETRLEHVIAQHGAMDLQKPMQGVFYGDPAATINDAWAIAQRQGIQPVTVNGADIYLIPRANSGYAGGFSGQLQNLNNVTIITQQGTPRIITGFPGNGLPLPKP